MGQVCSIRAAKSNYLIIIYNEFFIPQAKGADGNAKLSSIFAALECKRRSFKSLEWLKVLALRSREKLMEGIRRLA
jgi:hypothetical protein